MLLFKLFALLDILCGFLFVYNAEFGVPFRIMLGHALYLVTKGIMFKGDILSRIDMLVGFYGVFALFFQITFITYIAFIYLFIKGTWSLIY